MEYREITMNNTLDPALQALDNARQAVGKSDRAEARFWAEKAANLAPNQEEPW